MRPKIVLMILVVAIGVVALAAVLKTTFNRSEPQQAKVPEPAPVESAPTSAPPPQTNPYASNNAAYLEQLRATDMAKELDQVRELQAGGSDPNTTALLLGKVTSREPEVRRAALEALKQLNDTNAIPALEQAMSTVEDAREKVAFLDVIDYLKLPEATIPAADTNLGPMTETSPMKPRPMNPRFQSTMKNRRQLKARPAAPAGAQPGTAPTPATPPQ
jgi:hypothetical protein